MRSVKLYSKAIGLMLAVGAAFGQNLHSDPQITDVSLDQLTSACRSTNGETCSIQIATSIRTVVSQGILPPNTVVHFAPGASWEISGSLDFNGAQVDAPEHRIFPAGHLTNLRAARPEWFVEPNDGSIPAEGLRAAYWATKDGGQILLGERVYLSPFFDAETVGGCGGKTLLLNKPRMLVGTRRPSPDSLTQPTRLVDGTIIRGEICSEQSIKLAHLGIDEGPFAVSHNFHGQASFGIQALHTGVLGSSEGTRLKDISVLTTGVKDQHSVIIEGQRNAGIEDLWIWTLGGTHGLVLKSVDSFINGFHCSGASSDCLILKADYATDHAGDASHSQVSNVEISSMLTPGDTGGIVLDARWDSLHDLTLKNIHEQGTVYGVAAVDSILHTLSNVTFDGFAALHTTGPCVEISGGENITFRNFHCSANVPSSSFVIEGSKNFVLDHGEILCEGGLSCQSSTQDAITIHGGSSRVLNVISRGRGGYVVGVSPSLSQVVLAQDGTASAHPNLIHLIRHTPSWRKRLLAFKAQVKFLLRIAITLFSTASVTSRAIYLLLILALGAILLAGPILLFRRARRTRI